MIEKRRRWVEPSAFGAGAILTLVLVVMVNYLSWKHYKRFDWTSQDLYTLSEKSENVVRALDEPIEAVVFMSPGQPLFDPVRELLTRYAAASPKFSVRVIDPEKNLVEAQTLVDRFGLSHLDVIVLDRGDDRRVIEGGDLADYDYSGLQAGLGPVITAFKGEQVFTGVIVDLAENRKPRIAFTTGHGELSLDDLSAGGLSELRTLLGRDNFELEEWSPLSEPAVPNGIDAVVVAGPTTGFAEPEVAAVAAFVEAGGRLLALLDPIISASGEVASTGLEGLLAGYGVELGGDIVIDPQNPIPFFGAETFFVTQYGEHAVTRPLRQADVPVVVPLAQSVRVAETAAATNASILLETSSEGWGESDLENLRGISKDEHDFAGPVPIAVAVESASDEDIPGESLGASAGGSAVALEPTGGVGEPDSPDGAKPSGETPLRLAVFGDADFLTNSQLRTVGNAELAANTLNWLVERENLIAIAPKKPEQVRLSLTGAQLRSVGVLVFLILPGLALIIGAAVHSRRRR